MLIVAVLLVTVAIRFIIVLAIVYLLVPRGVECPHCKTEMMLIRNRVLERVIPSLQRRWCLECGWNGVTRRVSRGRRSANEPRRTIPR
jgi:hypothetical protein